MVQLSRLPGTPEPSHFWKGLNDIAIAGDAWGDDSNQLVVLLHGGGQTRHAWKGTGERLVRAGYRVVAFDARGHGDSGWAADGDYSYEAMVEDLRLVVDQLGDPKPALVGASMGGLTSLLAVGEQRVDAAALVLVDVAPTLNPDGASRIRAFTTANSDGFTSLDEVGDAIAAYQPHRKRPAALTGLAKNVRLGDDGRYYWHWDPQRLDGLDTKVLTYVDRLKVSASSLSLPTLLVRGQMSDVLTEAGVRDFLELCPASQYVDVAGAAHMVVGDQNDIFYNEIGSFLLNELKSGEPGT